MILFPLNLITFPTLFPVAKITRKNSIFFGILIFALIVFLVVYFAPVGVTLVRINNPLDTDAQIQEVMSPSAIKALQEPEPVTYEVPGEFINPVDRIMSDLNGVIRQYPHHNKALADKLYKEVKVLCWVNTWPNNHKTRAKSVKETWGKRCNKLLFISTKEDPELDSVALPLKDGRQYLWSKIRGAFTYVYKNYFDEYDWFVRADDDT